MGFRTLPVIPRTARPSITGTPVWYAEATQPRTQLDIIITIPSGSSRKLILLWGSDGGEFPTAVTFDPAGVAFPLIPVDGAVGQIGNLCVAAYYLDSPPTGTRTVRVATANAVWSVASLKVFQDARAGDPQGVSAQETGASISLTLEEGIDLLDAYAATADMVLGDGLSDGGLAPFSGQVSGADDVVNGSFLTTTSDRTHQNNGSVDHGWGAAATADLLLAAVSIPFSTGQISTDDAAILSAWEMDDLGTSFLDAQSRSDATLISGTAAGGQAPLFSGGGGSVSIQNAKIVAGHHVDWQVPSWSAVIYCQPRAWPASSNDAILSKDSGLPVPGGTQLEVETSGAIDFYIRNETGLAGTAIHVTGASGDGSLTLNVAHLIVLTYDDDAKTAKIYHRQAGGSVTLLASKTDANFFGLQNNASPLGLFCRESTSGNELDGVGDRVAFYSGVLSLAEIEALPAPTTITDPLAPGAIAAVSDNAGTVTQGTTDVDVLANDTNKTGPHYAIEISDDPNGRLSVINDQSATAKVRITMPAPATGDRVESGRYRVREGTSPTFGNPSNEATISWRQDGTGGGGYTPFPFVTTATPTPNHSGVTSRPTFNGANPLSAAVTDPMSGLQIVRLGGNPGTAVTRYNSSGNPVSTGLVFPNCLRNPNTPTAFRSINADGTIVAITEFIDAGTQPGGTLCRAYLVDVTGQYTGGVPWRIMRASASSFFGEVSAPFQFWDPSNPFRLFVKNNDGRIDAWYPIGTSGQSPNGPGSVATWVPAPSGYDSFVSPANGRDHDNVTSRDGRWHMAGCRRTSDGKWGGIRVDLLNKQYVGPFVISPDGLQTTNRPTMRQGDSLNGEFCMVQTPGSGGASQTGVTVPTGTVHNSNPTPGGFSHPCMVDVNGIPYIVGVQGNTVYSASWRLPTGPARTIAQVPQNNPTHATPLLGDRFEDNGGTGSGATTGDRYVVQIINNNSAGQRSMFAFRIGPSDTNVIRFLCDPRVSRTANYNECHGQGGWFGNRGFVVFASNWAGVGSNSSSQVSPYAVLLPSGWASPNNDGS